MSDGPDDLLEASRRKGVHTHIGAYHILHGVDLVVPKGQLTMLLGRNGAGKTTTLRTIMGLWQASKGACALPAGHHGAAHAADRGHEHRLCAREHGHLCRPDGERKHAAGRPQGAQRGADGRAALQWIFKLFPAVEKFWNHPAGKLSGGQKQMVAVARAIVEPRDLLIVDEPSKGLAPAIINNMIDAFDQLKKSGVTILLVEQNINFAKRLGDTVAVMDNGQVVHAGSMAALAKTRRCSVAAGVGAMRCSFEAFLASSP
jgi:branched-chain amino acid transport system ATP-binding protein